MGDFLSYSIISGIFMLAMYLVYKLLIARENQPAFNRGILLAIYLVSFCIYPLYNLIGNILAMPHVEPAINAAEANGLYVEPAGRPVWGTILIWLFLLGGAVVLTKTIVTWIRIVNIIHSGQKIKKDGYALVVIDTDKIAPFSWMRYVVVSRNDFINNNTAITVHELSHIRSFHCIDLIIAQLVCIINWFNPAAWLMREELMLVHEYQADMAVIQSGHNPQEYQMLLIKKAVGARFPSLANSINHSKLKKRITMMYKSKSSAEGKWKALALVPMVALALSAASVPAVKAAVSTISSSEVSLGKGNENLPKSAKFNISSLNNSGVETTVVINGEDLGEYVSVSNVFFTNRGNHYPATALNTTMTDGRATITAVFPFSDNYENAVVTLNINGKDVTLRLEDFRKSAQTSSVSISPSNGIVISQGNATLSTLGDMKIFLDGTPISEEEMKALNPESIASITIDKQGDVNKMFITSK